MIQAAVIILFCIYNICLFFIADWYFLAGLLLVELIWLRFRRIWRGLPFVLFIMLCNLCFSTLEISLLVGLRLLLALGVAYIFASQMSAQDFAQGFYHLLLPLKLFGVNVKDLALAITIALAFIPILAQEATTTRHALLAKGFNFSLKNVFTRPQIYLVAYLDGVFDRVEEVELALKAKGYE